MQKGFYIYKQTQGKRLKRYWHRRDGRWVDFFSSHCIYPTLKGADRVADQLWKEPIHRQYGKIIGVEEYE